MKIKTKNLFHLYGEEAYRIYWQQVYHCQPRLSSIMAIDKNLEIIVDEEGNLLAFRNDLPADMRGMVINTGHWHIFEEENLCSDLVNEVRTMVVGLSYNCCMN